MSEQQRSNGPEEAATKPQFYEICMSYDHLLQTLRHIAETAKVSRETVELMFMGNAVKQADAEKVLAALTQLTGQTWSLSNVQVPLIDEGAP